MNVVPELRESLVKAAARQAGGSAANRRPQRRSRLAGVVLTAGAVTALAVVGVVVLSGGSTPQRAAHPPLTGRPAAVLAAERLMAQVQLPPGAVAVASDQSHQRQLGLPQAGPLPPGSVDVHRFFLMRGDPQSVLNAVQRLNVKLEAGGGPSSSSAQGSSAAGHPTGSQISLASGSSELSPAGLVRRELDVSAATASAGQSAIRIDARAYWTPPRPAYTLIPAGVDTITVRVSGADASAIAHGLKTSTSLSSHNAVALVVGFFNDLLNTGPPPARFACGSGPRIHTNFIGADGRSLAVAVIVGSCGLVDLRTPAAHTILSLETPAPGITPLMFYRVLRLLVGVP